MGNLVVIDCHLWLTLTELKDSEKMAHLDAPVNPSGSRSALLKRRSSRMPLATSCQSAGVKSPAISCFFAAQRAGRPKAFSAAVRHEQEPAVRSRQPWSKCNQGPKCQRPRPDRNSRPPESKPRSWCCLSEEKSCTQMKTSHWRSLLAPLFTGGESNCHCFDCSTMQCNKVEKHTKLTSISGQIFSYHSPLPITHSHTRVVLNSPPPNGELPLMVCSQRSVAGTARGIRVGYEIKKEWLHASVLLQTDPFQRCVNVHCTGEACLSSARGNKQPPRKARCRDRAPHRPPERLLQSLISDSAQSWTWDRWIACFQSALLKLLRWDKSSHISDWEIGVSPWI